MKGSQRLPPPLDNCSQGISEATHVDLPGALSSPPACGELAIVPSQWELRVAQHSVAPYIVPPQQHSPYGALATSNVCPTCYRPLGTNEMGDVPSPPSEQHFTPQYFRALVQTQTPRLTICDSPSSQPREMTLPPTESPLPAQQHSRPCNNEEEEEVGAEGNGAGASGNGMATHGGRAASDDGSGGYYKRYFREIQKLGNGTFGGVYLCQHVMEGAPLGFFALKKIPVGDNTEYLHKVLHEVRILEEVKRHPNVVEYNHSWVDIAQIADFGPPVRCLFILMEYATLGSLDSYLEQHGTALPTIAVWYFFLSALAGVSHLHQKNILHRDLKPQNLLLTGRREKPPRVLVSDFGTATLLGELSYERTGGTGTMEYMAPELFECAPGHDSEYIHTHTKATDVWSLGMILHYLACDRTLPDHLPNGEVLLDVQKHAPRTRPPEMVQLIRAMLHRSPAKRPTCKELLKSTVVRTILQSFEKANLSSDILPTAAAEEAADSTDQYSMEDTRTFRVDWVRHTTPTTRSRRGSPTRNEEETECPQSPVVEVPLMLQYKTKESKRLTSAGLRGTLRGRRPNTVDRGVQTDYVKIVDE
ncbi:protein kinase [Trypanosoma grayi]|uniref:protein kinase n=1 Tax=Trypanosoma grayi TaxID=71804 RepID=UPI0004F3FBC6|nr:protein kinase [Trypanosoma grayi]KEG10420.1 protein kinase [Trypanosoma grayi]